MTSLGKIPKDFPLFCHVSTGTLRVDSIHRDVIKLSYKDNHNDTYSCSVSMTENSWIRLYSNCKHITNEQDIQTEKKQNALDIIYYNFITKETS